MLTIAWLAVLVGVLAIEWADGRFPFSRRREQHARPAG
jgi:hypothetical protein